MNINIQTPRRSLNKAFLKVKPERSDIENFKTNLTKLLDRINEDESEEFHKNIVSRFLDNTRYAGNHYINTKGRTDLVIHNGPDAKSPVGVIIEAKKPTNKAEMPAKDNINSKAMHELLLYYLRERIKNKNNDIKHIIATNIYEWFIFDAQVFEKLFAQNKELVKEFTDFEEGRKSGTTTGFFYKEIAEPFINSIEDEIPFTHFDLRNYEKLLRGVGKTDDTKLIPLFKTFSPQHLLKLPFTNDSNTLDKTFYAELLHIIGLKEKKQKNKKLIERKDEGERSLGTLLENSINQLDILGKITRMPDQDSYGNDYNEKLFNVALELCITWVNRILFLKLMEAQLIKYHKGDESYAFLNLEKIDSFDELNSLFFSVLARQPHERNEAVKGKFEKVPFLNSSLFEPSEIEHQTILVSNLNDDRTLPVHPHTVLRDSTGKRIKGELTALEYLFRFLDAYDFSSEGHEEIQEENKSLINASVLGLIFEKINGYKEGSFFTPGFITMYMCKETIERAVVQKFNDAKDWNCKTFDDLREDVNHFIRNHPQGRKEARDEANKIVNSLKICDPAVGSGHFLVSALNEIIAIKYRLNILQDRNGTAISGYKAEVVNDELIVSKTVYDDEPLFEYIPGDEESQRIQETLFHEKQTIIENCLFGVDINPNSVKICRLRLWIELLKNAYYKKETGYKELETLPNIDINIKCGNSLISRFPLDADLGQALKQSKWTVDSYRMAVQTYRNAESKEEKSQMVKLINDIKNDFRTEINKNDPKVKRLKKLEGELFNLTNQTQMFERTKKEQEEWNKKVDKLTKDIEKLQNEIEEIQNNRIYDNAFEWRFEFPEVLDGEGNFVGFDVCIGNPPYVNFANLSESERNHYKKYKLYKNKTDLYAFFVGLASDIKQRKGLVCLIMPHTWVSTVSFHPLRKLLLEKLNLSAIVDLNFGVFKDAYVKTVIIHNSYKSINSIKIFDYKFNLKAEVPRGKILEDSEVKINLTWSTKKQEIFDKIKNDSVPLEKIIHFSRGIKTSNDARFLFKEKKDSDFYKVIRGRNIKSFKIDYNNEYIWYRPDLMKEKAGCLPHTKEVFLVAEKIITQRVNSSGQLLATYDSEQYFCLDTTNVSTKVFDRNCNLMFIVGVMNSKLINWWFNDEFKNPTISGYELHQIPIKRDGSFENEITGVVSEILYQKKADPSADTTTLEAEIDRMVYDLYGLTEEEVRIVEGG